MLKISFTLTLGSIKNFIFNVSLFKSEIREFTYMLLFLGICNSVYSISVRTINIFNYIHIFVTN